MSTFADRVAARNAAGTLSTAQQVRAVEAGLLTAAQVSTEAKAQAANQATIKADLKAALATLDALVGATSDPAGTGTLRAIKATPNATIKADPAPYVKALADAMITIARTAKKDIRLDIRELGATD